MRWEAHICRHSVHAASAPGSSLAAGRNRPAVAETGSHPVERWGAKSLADDLATGQGVVFSRAASTLRSVETQPLIGRFVSVLNLCITFRSTSASRTNLCITFARRGLGPTDHRLTTDRLTDRPAD